MKAYYYFFIQLLLLYNNFESSNAHGFMSVPDATYQDTPSYTSFVGVMPFKDISIDIAKTPQGSPEANIVEFTPAYNKLIKKNITGFRSLKDFVNRYKYKEIKNECGRIDPNDKKGPRPVPPKGIMCWQNNELRSGFLQSHYGPCEVWIDKTLVLSSEDCLGQFGWNFPSCLPIEYKKCNSETCTLKFFWAAVHSKQNGVQLYSTCVPITVKEGVNQIKPDLATLQRSKKNR